MPSKYVTLWINEREHARKCEATTIIQAIWRGQSVRRKLMHQKLAVPEIELMNSDGEEVVNTVVETAPKPKKTKKKKAKKTEAEHSAEDSDPEVSSDKKSKKSEKKDRRTTEPEKEQSDNDEPSNDVSSLKAELNSVKKERDSLKKTLNHIVDTLESVGKKTKSHKHKRKPGKHYKISKLTRFDVEYLVMRKDNWGDYELPDDKDKQMEFQITKPKLPEEIKNVKLRKLVVNAVRDKQLLVKLKIHLVDGKITTHNVSAIVKNHYRENYAIPSFDYSTYTKIFDIWQNKGESKQTLSVIKEHIIKDPEIYDFTKGDFNGMFEEYVSSD